MSSILTIEQQLEELKLELAHCNLTKRERAEALSELAWLKEQQRIDEEANYFAWIECEAERLPRQARFSLDQVPF